MSGNLRAEICTRSFESEYCFAQTNSHTDAQKSIDKKRSKQGFGNLQTKKKRAWSPLKTTRYGVSARRPKEEPARNV